MGKRPSEEEAAPGLELQQVSVERSGIAEFWSVGWLIRNDNLTPLRILAARLPHGQFKAEEQRFEPPLDLAPRDSARFHASVRCHEPPGLVTENAFVIFSVIWLAEEWRIFIRIRVVAGTDGTPQTATELVTAQKVGFSGITP